MTFVSSESSGQQLVVWAEHARIDPAADQVLLESVTVRVGGGEAGVSLDLNCDRARVSLRTDGFRLEGNVRGRDGQGRHFRTAWLEFDGVERVLRTTAPVTVTDETGEYRGGALVYDVDGRSLRLLDGASVVRRSR